jgi:tetratricopeptide (TPR) repeat protein
VVEWPRKGELIAQLRGDQDLDEPTRAAALRIAQQLAERPQENRLADATWSIVGRANRDAEDYERAVRWAEEALNLGPAPAPSTMTILGAAYYRVGRFQDSRDTLDRADRLPSGPDPDPEWAGIRQGFRVMMLHRTGSRDEARSQLDRLRRQLRDLPWGLTTSPALLREAEALIDAKPPGTEAGERQAHPGESR